MHTFTYQKGLLYTILLHVFKNVESLQFILNAKSYFIIAVLRSNGNSQLKRIRENSVYKP